MKENKNMKNTQFKIVEYLLSILVIIVGFTTGLTKLSPGLAQTKPESITDNNQLGQNPRRKACPLPSRVLPSEEVKTVTIPKLGIALNMPINYRLEESNYDNNFMILLYNPADDKLIDCCEKNRVVGCGHQTKPITINKSAKIATANTPLLPEIFSPKGGYNKILENVTPTTIANQKAMVFVQKSISRNKSMGDYISLNARFFNPNNRSLISISIGHYGDTISQADREAFNVIISSSSLI
ncbi:MAG: hypothetical protein F6K24_02725 [Okeania sp. SIO2D1]|nr:hypothetical protein [Okeania sp. SIO2D1]